MRLTADLCGASNVVCDDPPRSTLTGAVCSFVVRDCRPCAPKKINVSNCPHCKQPRRFEMQLVPTTLHHLGINGKDSLDWGLVAVYSCGSSCGGNGVFDESLHVEASY